MSNRSLKRYQRAISTLESDSPVDLYWLHREYVDSPSNLSTEGKGDKVIICDSFWDDFVIVSKAVKLRNPEATVYDVFNFIREHMLGGWTMLDDSTMIQKIDAEVEREYQKERRAGKWS